VRQVQAVCGTFRCPPRLPARPHPPSSVAQHAGVTSCEASQWLPRGALHWQRCRKRWASPAAPATGGAQEACLHCNAPPSPCRGAAGGRAQGAAGSGCLGCGRMAGARGGRQRRGRPRPAAARRACAVPVGDGAAAGPVPHRGAPQRARLARTPPVQLLVRPLDTRAPRHPSGERRRLCCSAPRPAAALRVSARVVTARPLPAETGSWTLSARLPAAAYTSPHPPPAAEGSSCRLSGPLRRGAHQTREAARALCSAVRLRSGVPPPTCSAGAAG
jgi:hypothetical protein